MNQNSQITIGPGFVEVAFFTIFDHLGGFSLNLL